MSQNPEQTIAELQQKIKSLELQLKKAKDSSGYGLKWEEKPEIFEERAQNALPLLKEDKSLLIDNKSDLDHIIIEGDNYHALSALNYTHKGMIDVIYIDPPYNTGNEDFIYNDNYVDPEDEYRHSKWLSFISKRLKLAKKLLSENGIIFISIDDNEQANLKLLCDDIFLENNYRSTITVVANPGGRDYGGIAKTTEYILVYSRTPSAIISKIPDEGHVFDLEDDLGPFELRELRNRNIKFNDKNRPNLCYPFYVNPHDIDKHGLCSVSLEKSDEYNVEVYPLKSQGVQTVWRWGKEERSRKNLNINIKAKLKKDNTFMIVEKYRDELVMMKNLRDDKRFRTENGSLQLKEIFGYKPFDYPKPVDIPKRLVSSMPKDAIVLDFFAGSGTTGHAVLELNKEDGGHRQFILCSNRENSEEDPDKNICKNVTYERVKRVMQGYKNSEGENIEGLFGGNLRYYTTEFIENKKSTDDLRQSFIYLCDDLLCIKEDTFNEYKSELLSDKLKCYQKNNHYTVILYDIREIEKLQQLLSILDGKISVYIFSLSKDSCEEELQEFSEKITIENIPDDILETYKKIF